MLERYAGLIETTLSDEHVCAKIEELRALLEPEMERERERWEKSSVEVWNKKVEKLSDLIADGYAAFTVDNLCSAFGVTAAERAEYFGF